MEKFFIPYEQSLALKELGFNECCLGEFNTEYQEFDYCALPLNGNYLLNTISRPLYSQAFEWFRKEHKLCSWVYMSNARLYHYSILKDNQYISSNYNNSFITYEEAQLECLIKLIELCLKKI